MTFLHASSPKKRKKKEKQKTNPNIFPPNSNHDNSLEK